VREIGVPDKQNSISDGAVATLRQLALAATVHGKVRHGVEQVVLPRCANPKQQTTVGRTIERVSRKVMHDS
jgi:hypothetical protein